MDKGEAEGRWADRFKDGRKLVGCDQRCEAFEEPDRNSLKELRDAWAHWESHSLMYGCSHAC